jgi:predicted nucleotidyltransferase
MLLDELHQMNTRLNSLALQFGASRLRVFGSVARREETPDSDIDFLVDLPRGYDLFTQRLALAQGLAEVLCRRVELVPEHELNPHIKAQILAEAVAL